MGNSFGKYFIVTTFGESHGPAVGAVVEGMPPHIDLTCEQIQRDLDKRRPGLSKVSSPRCERDRVEILSGVQEGLTTGAPVALLIRNEDANSADYRDNAEKFRPGHADYTYWKKYGLKPQPGGGRASGRETAARVAAGAVARALLMEPGISVRAYTVGVGNITAAGRDLDQVGKNPLRCPDAEAAAGMQELILRSGKEGDSVGGVVELVISGLRAGLGRPVFDKLDAMLAHGLVSIGGVKGVEFGEGFGAARLLGSQMNDEIMQSGFATNRSGGILGGISTGENIVLRIAVKPTPSIAKSQQTISTVGKSAEISVKGRHDVCLCPRICPVAEAMAAIVIADALLEQRIIDNS